MLHDTRPSSRGGDGLALLQSLVVSYAAAAAVAQSRLDPLLEALPHLEHQSHDGTLELYGLGVGIPAAGVLFENVEVRGRRAREPSQVIDTLSYG